MNLFTYLMSKKGYNYLPHKDLFSYLLGKNNSIKTETGTEITINSIRGLLKSLKLFKESTQNGTPTPENPVEIKTVKGYKNELNVVGSSSGGGVDSVGTSDGKIVSTGTTTGTYYNIIGYINQNLPAGDYVFSITEPLNHGLKIRFRNSQNVGIATYTIPKGSTSVSIDLSENAGSWLIFAEGNVTVGMSINEEFYPMLVKGTEELPYVPYGTNWIYLKATNGTDTIYKTIPLNENEIAGIGNYKDELIVDKTGHCYLGKNTRNLELAITNMDNLDDYPGWRNQTQLKNDYNNLNASFNSVTSYLCNIHNFSNGININTNGAGIIFLDKSIFNLTQTQWKEQYPDLVFKIIYGLQETNLIDLNYTIDMTIFKGTNIITNSADADMIIEYI